MIFSTTDFDALKEKEKNLRQKEEGAYFRSKTKDSKLYKQIIVAMVPYLTEDKL